MSLIALVVMVVIGVACLFGWMCHGGTNPGAGTAAPVSRQAVRSLSRVQVQERLRTLESRKAPEAKMGAMCYDMERRPAPPARTARRRPRGRCVGEVTA